MSPDQDRTSAGWITSSYSPSSGGKRCALPGNSASAGWTKSSYSSSSGGGCLEFSRTHTPAGIVPVRDSKTPDGPVLMFPTPGWTSFIAALASGRLPDS